MERIGDARRLLILEVPVRGVRVLRKHRMGFPHLETGCRPLIEGADHFAGGENCITGENADYFQRVQTFLFLLRICCPPYQRGCRPFHRVWKLYNTELRCKREWGADNWKLGTL